MRVQRCPAVQQSHLRAPQLVGLKALQCISAVLRLGKGFCEELGPKELGVEFTEVDGL